jgi:CheY-like chemotaxis protein
MVHGLALQLGGALTIRSRPGLGTNVELWLPQSDAPPDAVAPTSSTSAAVPVRGTALLVDDEQFVRLSTANMLSDLGYRVIEAASAEGALQVAERGEVFDILITDHLMPGMTGTSLAQQLQTRWPHLPVLVVSGYAEDDGVAADLPRLSKPFRAGELATALVQILNRKGGEARTDGASPGI